MDKLQQIEEIVATSSKEDFEEGRQVALDTRRYMTQHHRHKSALVFMIALFITLMAIYDATMKENYSKPN